MSRDGSEALQEAIYSALTTALTNATPTLGPVYSHVPEQTAYPYTFIGNADVLDWSTKDSVGTEQTVIIEFYSQYRGSAEVRSMAGAAYDALHHASLTLTGQQLVLMQLTNEMSELLPDGLTYKISARYRALIESTT